MSRIVLAVLALGNLLLAQLVVPIQAQAAPQGLAVLDSQGWDRLQRQYGVPMQLSMLSLRLLPNMLDDKKMMQWFIIWNNEGTPTAVQSRQLANSEFDYPALSTFYKSQAQKILSPVSNTIKVELDQVAVSTGGGPPSIQGYPHFGTYDVGRHVFPFILRGRPATISIDNVKFMPTGFGNVTTFLVKFTPVNFSEVAVDEKVARDFVMLPGNGEGMGENSRRVRFELEIEIQPTQPLVTPAPNFPSFKNIQFEGKLKRVSIVAFEERTNLGDIPLTSH